VAGVQVPTEPATSQASHWPEHLVSQHTPSMQLELPHSESRVQALPCLAVHLPSLPGDAHDEPAPQSATPQHTPSVQESPALQGEVAEHLLPSPMAGTQALLLVSQ